MFHLKFDPAQIVTTWTAAIAVLSLANKFLLMPFAPNVARFVSAILSIPSGHLANFLEDIKQLLGDVTPPPPPAAGSGPASPPKATPTQSPPPASLFTAGPVALACSGLLACGLLNNPSIVPGAEKVLECVAAHFSSWQDLLTNCSAYSLAEIEAAIQTLLADPTFVKAHPDAVDPLLTRLGEVHAKMAEHK